MSWLTATVLQYIAGALLVLCGMLGWRLHAAAAGRDVAAAQRDAAVTERDAWRGKASGCAAANDAYGVVLDNIRAEQARRDQQAAEAAQRAAAEVQAAQAAAAAAERQRDDYRRRYDARPTGCDAALKALDAACPLLEGY